MTYQQYLDNWEQMFGDELTGDYGYYRRGVRVPYRVHQLTLEEFNQHLEALQQANAEFKKAHVASDDTAMGNALAAALPHELALLV